MKITSATAEQMEMQEGGKGFIILGSGLIGMGLFFAAIFVSFSDVAVGLTALAVMAVIGTLLILFNSTIIVTANRRTGQLLYEKKRLAGNQKSIYSFQEVFGIETRHEWQTSETTDSDGNTTRDTNLMAKSIILLRDGRKLVIGSQTNNSRRALVGIPGSVSNLAATLAQFLNVPYQETAPR